MNGVGITVRFSIISSYQKGGLSWISKLWWSSKRWYAYASEYPFYWQQFLPIPCLVPPWVPGAFSQPGNMVHHSSAICCLPGLPKRHRIGSPESDNPGSMCLWCDRFCDYPDCSTLRSAGSPGMVWDGDLSLLRNWIWIFPDTAKESCQSNCMSLLPEPLLALWGLLGTKDFEKVKLINYIRLVADN